MGQFNHGYKKAQWHDSLMPDLPSPQNLAELQTFMGMGNYLNRFSWIMAQT